MTEARGPFWLGTSWKMNDSRDKAASYAQELGGVDWSRYSGIAPFILPSFPFVEMTARALSGTRVRVGVQNVHWKQDGAFTGEVSPPMAVEIGASLAMIGHSERRSLFGETDETVRDRTAAAIAAGLTPIISIGDSRLESEAGATAEAIIRQAKIALSAVDDADVERCLLFYEPVWSIGAGGTAADPDAVSATLRQLRAALVAQRGPSGLAIPLLYGGGVGLDNVERLAVAPCVDGLMAGRAASTAPGFVALVERAHQARLH